jgi:hypothetical protein
MSDSALTADERVVDVKFAKDTFSVSLRWQLEPQEQTLKPSIRSTSTDTSKFVLKPNED